MSHHSWLTAGTLLTSAAAMVAFGARASIGGNQGADDGSGSGVVSSGPMPYGGASPPASAPNAVRPEPAVDLRRARWTWVEPVPGAPEALIHGTFSGAPPCTVLSHVDVIEAPDHISVTLWVGRRPGAPCTAEEQLGYPFVTRVRLAAPMGNRPVFDGAA